jgi:hypothetical protein
MTLTNLPSYGQSVAVSAGRLYPGGHRDEDVEAFALEDGQAAINNPSRWGENTHSHTIDVLNAAHDTNAGLVAHQYRENVQRTVDELDAEIPKARSAEQAAHTALENKRRAEVSKLRLRHSIEMGGLELPSLRSLIWIVAGIGLLFLGETGLVSASFQIFGLADKPAVPGIGLTDDLHITAYASVTALLVLAHVVGHNLRLIEHDLEQRQRAVNAEAKSKLPGVSWFHVALIGVCLVMAVLALDALATVRVDYLRAQGKHVQSLPFLAIQIGIFAAAAFLMYLHTHPYGRRWMKQLRATTKAEKDWKARESAFNYLVGSINANIDLLDCLLAQAGHHVGVSASDVRRQASLFARRVILSQPEPTVERLFPAELSQPTTHVGGELKEFLIGIAPVPTFEKLTNDALVKRQEEIGAEVRELEEMLSAIRLRHEDSRNFAEYGGGPR